MHEIPFWRRKTLAEMTQEEWESLCDGCGRCCLNKLEDEDTGRVYFTNVGCRLLDGQTCRCRDYEHRMEKVADCLQLNPENVTDLGWLPPTCGYRLIAQGRDLYWWHPLVSGDPETVHIAGVSVRGRVSAFEQDVPDEQLEDYLVDWPMQVPASARAKAGSGKTTDSGSTLRLGGKRGPQRRRL
ncbi:MAG TPA: YcgN family cysteine cluster protein [Xanthobacteraceae bacterium]|jgi:hypothetical protein|nr:YcgN family cysteine cluster protein [Xanthobacteraceae bacterium]